MSCCMFQIACQILWEQIIRFFFPVFLRLSFAWVQATQQRGTERVQRVFSLWVEVRAHRNPFLMDCGLREVCAQWHEQLVLQGTERDEWILLKIIFISISLQRIHVCSWNIHFEIWQTSLAAVGKFKQTHWEFSVTLTCCKHRRGLGACSAYHSAAAE